MSRHAKTSRIIEAALVALRQHNPMTVRQAYYQLVSGQVIENSKSQYNSVSKALVEARKEGIIPWEWIEDRIRRPRMVQAWDGLGDFIEAVRRSYRRNVWESQPQLVECWLEKDALSGIFEELLRPYGVTLNVGRGYDGWSSIHNAADRYADWESVSVLYFGDFDPSGEDMVRSLRDRLEELGATPRIVKVSLTMEDIVRYRLPPDPAKLTDTRAKDFIAKNGDISVELDALPLAVLKSKIRQAVEASMDLEALAEVRHTERDDIERLEQILEQAS
jgi:hypothetical protein